MYTITVANNFYICQKAKTEKKKSKNQKKAHCLNKQTAGAKASAVFYFMTNLLGVYCHPYAI